MTALSAPLVADYSSLVDQAKIGGNVESIGDAQVVVLLGAHTKVHQKIHVKILQGAYRYDNGDTILVEDSSQRSDDELRNQVKHLSLDLLRIAGWESPETLEAQDVMLEKNAKILSAIKAILSPPESGKETALLPAFDILSKAAERMMGRCRVSREDFKSFFVNGEGNVGRTQSIKEHLYLAGIGLIARRQRDFLFSSFPHRQRNLIDRIENFVDMGKVFVLAGTYHGNRETSPFNKVDVDILLDYLAKRKFIVLDANKCFSG